MGKVNRRSFLSNSVRIGGAGWVASRYAQIAAAAETAYQRDGRHCVILWMAGGPSQLDTFDMKPDHRNGGEFKEIQTDVPGIRMSEHLPKLARHAERLAILRGMSTKEGDHQRGTVVMRTGHIPGGPVQYPAIGCSLSKALENPESQLPGYVTIAPGFLSATSTSPGFLGPKYAATSVDSAGPTPDDGFAQLRVDHLDLLQGVDVNRHQRRLELWREMQRNFSRLRATDNVAAQDAVYRSAIAMIDSDAKVAFDLTEESDAVRESYGRGAFGQGCLMARRLIERGVPLVEVTLGSGLEWDTHAENFDRVRSLSEQLDAGWSSLMTELDERGLLGKTTILWAGEFGRTPEINSNGGRDHFPQAFTCVLGGGSIAGGQVYGATSKDGKEVTDGKMNQQDLLATLCQALDVSPATENIAEGGRPIAIAEGKVVSEVLS